MGDDYSPRVNPHYDEALGLHYERKYVKGNTRIYVMVPDITEEERKKRLQVTLDVMSAISSRLAGRQVRYIQPK